MYFLNTDDFLGHLMTGPTTTVHYELADCVTLEARDRLSSGLGSFMLLGSIYNSAT